MAEGQFNVVIFAPRDEWVSFLWQGFLANNDLHYVG
jgi:hypothetical protein